MQHGGDLSPAQHHAVELCQQHSNCSKAAPPLQAFTLDDEPPEACDGDELPMLAGVPLSAEPRPSGDAGHASTSNALGRLTGWETALQVLWDPRLRGLSLWWVLCVGPVMSYVESYSINLFYDLRPDVDSSGHVVALTRLCMSGAALILSLIHI